MRNIYSEAIEVQNAVNLGAIVYGFAELLDGIRSEPGYKQMGTQYINEHPVTVMFVNKLASLCHADAPGRYSYAYAICREHGKLGAGINYKEIPMFDYGNE